MALKSDVDASAAIAAKDEAAASAATAISAAAGVADAMASINVSPDGTLDQSGSPLPPWGVVDQSTGRFLVWINAAGKLFSARGGASEIATLADIADLTALGAVVTVESAPVDAAGDALPPIYVVDKNTGYLLAWIDAQGRMYTGAGQVGGSASSSSLIVSYVAATGILKVSVPTPKKGSDAWITYTWVKSVATLSVGFWKFESVRKSTRVGGSFTMTETDTLLGGGASGFGVWSEARDGSNNSIDNGQAVPTTSPLNFFGLPAHGNGWPLAFAPSSSTAEPLIYVDGVRLNLASDFAGLASEVRFQQASKIFRSRSPALDPNVASPTIKMYEQYRVTVADQLWHQAEAIYQEQLTMGGGYFPLLCITDVFQTQQRDLGGVVQLINLPAQYDDNTVTNNVAGITRVVYANSGGQFCEIVVSPPEIWASGQRPYGTKLAPEGDIFQLKTSDPGLWKAYWSLGANKGTYGGVANLYRANAGEVWRRNYTLKFIV